MPSIGVLKLLDGLFLFPIASPREADGGVRTLSTGMGLPFDQGGNRYYDYNVSNIVPTQLHNCA